MIKLIKYFFEAFFIYLFFIIGKLIGLSYSRSLFSFIFKKIGPMIRSDKILSKNLFYFSSSISESKKDEIKFNMWSNYGMTFIEYIFLERFRKKLLRGLYIVARFIFFFVISIDISSKFAKCPEIKITGLLSSRILSRIWSPSILI